MPVERAWPSVSIITVNYNGLEHLGTCFRSLRALDYPADRFEVVCVDNASADGSLDFIRSEHPEVRLIEAGSNLGFAAGCNLGVRSSDSDCIAFLNNDARVDPGWLKALVGALDDDPQTVCSAAKMLDWEGAEVDFVEGHLCFHGFARQAHWREHYQPGAFGESQPLLFACGGAMLVDRRVFLDIGGFDERFWMFFEDVDLGWRLWVMGYRVVFAPEAITYHRHHASASRLNSYRRNYLYERNGLFMIIKNYEEANLARVLPAALSLMVHRSSDYLQRAAGGGFDLLDPENWQAMDESALERRISLGDLAPLVALRAVLEDLPGLLRDRAAVQARRRRPDTEILPLFGQPRRLYPMGHMLIRAYCEAQQHLWRALGLDGVFQTAPLRIAILSTVGAPSLGFEDSREGRRADAIAEVLEAAGHDIVRMLPRSLVESRDPAEIPERVGRFSWDDKTLDNRILRLGPDVVIATHWRALAFARLSIYRPVVLDHDDRDPLADFEREVAERFENPRERKLLLEMLLKRDYLCNVDLFTAASPAAMAALKSWLNRVSELELEPERFLLAEDVGATLEAYCRHPQYHADKLDIDFRPPFPRTPLLELPRRAMRSLQDAGPAQLGQDLAQYSRWIVHGIQRRLRR
jgi:GT2 family glycosyltransferase